MSAEGSASNRRPFVRSNQEEIITSRLSAMSAVIGQLVVQAEMFRLEGWKSFQKNGVGG